MNTSTIIASLLLLGFNASLISSQNAAPKVLRGSSQIAYGVHVEENALVTTEDGNCTLDDGNCYDDSDCCSNYCAGPFGYCEERPCREANQSCGPNEEFKCCLGLYCDGTSCQGPIVVQ